MSIPVPLSMGLAVVTMFAPRGYAQALPDRPAMPPPAEARAAAAFPDGARLGYVDLDRVAALSNEGRAASARLDEVRKKKAAEVTERGRQVRLLQQKVAQGSGVLNEAAFGRLQREFERAPIDFERFQDDAQADVQGVQQELPRAFTARVFPVIGRVATEKKLWAVFGSGSGLLWHHPALDLSEEIARRLDAQATAK